MTPFASELAKALSKYPLSVRRALSHRLVEGASPDLALAGQALGRMASVLVIDEVVVRAAVDSTGTEREDVWLLRAVLDSMAKQPKLVNGDWIDRMSRRGDTAEAALRTIWRLRDPKLLPSVARVIAGPAASPAYPSAVNALSGFLSDEAAELLLMAARKAGREEDRSRCLAQLETIAALQDAEARWATRRVRAVTREATVSQLLGLLGDEESMVRVEAVRGLATWEAVEALPQLILLLKDGDADVAAAARAALDQLNESGEDG